MDKGEVKSGRRIACGEDVGREMTLAAALGGAGGAGSGGRTVSTGVQHVV